MRFISIVLYTLLLIPFTACAQATDGERMMRNALQYLGTPYVPHTLERNDKEQLVVNLKEVDCTTFVEYALAQSLAESREGDMKDYLQKIRYRNGEINGYTSRLHYITEWIENGVQNDFLEDITALHSKDTLPIRLSFMSSHPAAYQQLKNSPTEIEKIRRIEQKLSGHTIHYLPKSRIPHTGLPWIKNGDILCITTDIPGLDIVHLGIACYKDKQLHLLHASSSHKKVLISHSSFASMFLKNNTWTGVRVIRILPPKEITFNLLER